MSPAARMVSIEARRLELGLSEEELAVAAGISRTWYRSVRADPAKSTPATIARLSAALRQPERGTDPLVPALFHAVLASVCDQLGLDVGKVRAADPRRGATADAEWRAAAQARQVALWICNTGFGVRQRRLAEAVGLTPAAVCLALRSVTDLCDDPAWERRIENLSTRLTGAAA